MRSNISRNSLDFKLLNHIVSGSTRKPEAVRSAIVASEYDLIGPSLFFCQLSGMLKNVCTLGDLAHWPIVDQYLRLRQYGGFSKMPLQSSIAARPFEIIWSPMWAEDFADLRWKTFIVRLEASAKHIGIGSKTSAAIAGACTEMVDNVLEHSTRPESAMVAYATQGNTFEYVVLDSEEEKGTGTFLKRKRGQAPF